MADLNAITKEQFLEMKPASFLKDGFRDAANQPRAELASIWATAGATQMEAVRPMELAAAIEALRQVLPLHEGTPSERYLTACEEATEVAVGLLGTPLRPE